MIGGLASSLNNPAEDVGAIAMKIGILTGVWYIAESATVIESLRRAAALGFRYVDLHGVFHAGPIHLSEWERQAVGAELRNLGLTPRNYVLHAPTNPASATEKEQAQNIAYLKEGIDLALSWGMKQVMLNAGQWTYGIPRREAWQRSAYFLQQVCDYAATRGCYIAQEPEPYVWFLVNDLPSATRMMAEVKRDNFTLLVDLGHLSLSRESPEDLQSIKEAIIHAHFSDHQINLHTNQIIGSGVTCTAEYLAGLRAIEIDRLIHRFGYDQLTISFELGVPGDQIPDPDEWVRRSLCHIQQIAPDLSIE